MGVLALMFTTTLKHIIGFLCSFAVFAALALGGGLIADTIVGHESWWTVLGFLLGIAVYFVDFLYREYLYGLFDDDEDDWMA